MRLPFVHTKERGRFPYSCRDHFESHSLSTEGAAQPSPEGIGCVHIARICRSNPRRGGPANYIAVIAAAANYLARSMVMAPDFDFLAALTVDGWKEGVMCLFTT